MQRTKKRMRCPLGTLLATYLLLSGLSLFPLVKAFSQPLSPSGVELHRDSLAGQRAPLRWVAPVVLIPVGLALLPDYTNSHFDRFYIRSEIQDRIHFRTHADDYLQYGPAAVWIGLNLAGVKGRSKPLDRAMIGLLAYGISTGLVLGLKPITHEIRPDGSDYYSFPSGHTANAFTGAGLLRQEYSGVSPWIPIGGYAMATSTGILRVTNDRHWVSDVLVGAGIGLLSAEVAYHVYPWLKRTLKKHK